MQRRLRRARAKIAVTTLPPAAITPRAANWADPAKTSIDISTTDQAGRCDATASTPNEAPKTKTAMAIGAAGSKISFVDRVPSIPAIKEERCGRTDADISVFR